MRNILLPAIGCSRHPRGGEPSWAYSNQDPHSPNLVARRKGYSVQDEAHRLHEGQGRIPTVVTPMVRTRPSQVAKQTYRRRLSGFTPDETLVLVGSGSTDDSGPSSSSIAEIFLIPSNSAGGRLSSASK